MRLHPPARIVLERIVRNALEEDLGRGDITTEACVPPSVPGHAFFRAREAMVWCGVPVIEMVYRLLDEEVEVEAKCNEGSKLQPGELGAEIKGTAMSILRGERVALNFVQRMCGIATMTRSYVMEVPEEARCRITDTRKTTPGLRALERYAVRCGGGHNHRDDLSSAVLIKDNHIAAAGGVRPAIERARSYAPHTSRIECEVDDFDQLAEALEAGADIIMLDNFDDAQVQRAVTLVAGRARLEASGGITKARIAALANAGVNMISVGALTHSAPSADVGLDWA